MPCEHKNGGLQLFTYEQGAWHSRCLCCGDDRACDDPGYPAQAGTAACTGFLRYGQRRFSEAADCFRQASEISGDARYHFAALMCRYGVTWCGDELHPTFGAYPLPAPSMQETPEWQAVEQAAGQLGSAVYLSMSERLAQLEEIVSCIRAQEGLSACDVFLCYRRTSANLQAALRLYRDLTARGLRVFCADVTTRGKTQEQFEAEVYHALNTAEYLVLLPGEGEDALTPWLRNELARAAAAGEKRLVCAEGGLSEKLGEHLPMDEIRNRLIASAADAAPERLYRRAIAAFTAGETQTAAALLQRAAVKKHTAARLLAAELCSEGLVLPADPGMAATFRRLAGTPSDDCRQQVNNDFIALETAMNITHRQALVYLVADVSDAGFTSSQLLAKSLIAALNAERHLAGSSLCIVGYDRHARVLGDTRELVRYGTPEAAARTLRTADGCSRTAYAAKGLRCAADHLQQHGAQGREPAVILLRPCFTADQDSSLEAAWLTTAALIAPDAAAELRSADQIEDCIRRLRALVQ